MLTIREALKTVLGASLSVTHQGNPVTVAVIDAGRGEQGLLPLVAFMSEFGISDPSNIGGGAVDNDVRCDLEIQAIDSDSINGPLLITDTHSKIEQLIRAAEKTTGTSFYTYISTFRDFPPHFVRGYPVYRRVLTVRAWNLQSY